MSLQFWRLKFVSWIHFDCITEIIIDDHDYLGENGRSQLKQKKSEGKLIATTRLG